MNILPTNSASLLEKYCPCDAKKMAANLAWTLPWIGVAISIAGVATMIFASSIEGTIGFALFGLTILYDLYSEKNRKIVNLTDPVQKPETPDVQSAQRHLVHRMKKFIATQRRVIPQLNQLSVGVRPPRRTKQRSSSTMDQEFEKELTVFASELQNWKSMTDEIFATTQSIDAELRYMTSIHEECDRMQDSKLALKKRKEAQARIGELMGQVNYLLDTCDVYTKPVNLSQ
jgi:hypothetical protein